MLVPAAVPVSTCVLVWLGSPAEHLDKGTDCKGYQIRKGVPIEVPADLAGRLLATHGPASVKIARGKPMQVGSLTDPVAQTKRIKRDLKSDPARVLGEIPDLGDIPGLWDRKATLRLPEGLAPGALGWVAVVLQAQGRGELAAQVLREAPREV